MIIGILTLPFHTNYGGILQAYALQTVLERMGYEVVILNRDRDVHKSLFRQMLSLGKFLVKKCLLRKDVKYLSPKRSNFERHEREKNTSEFIDKHLHTRLVKAIEPNVFNDVDAIIVGSDQVWRPRYFKMLWKKDVSNAFLQFAEQQNIKRISYAASFGTDNNEFSNQESIECARLLKQFDAVSVRELFGVTMCREVLGYTGAVQVLDPTLLLSKEDYVCIVNQAKVPQSPGNLMCYILDMSTDIRSLVDRISGERQLAAFYANARVKDNSLPLEKRVQPLLEKWLRGFMDAEFVITDSFHACVFCIIFGKPFVVLGNPVRGVSRYESLLSLFGLESHLISSLSDYDSEQTYALGDDVAEKWTQLKNKSLQFLNDALK